MVIYRLGYAALIMLLLGTFSLLLSLKLVPYWQTKYRYEPVTVDPHALTVTWAESPDTRSDETVVVPLALSDQGQFSFLNARQAEQQALKIVVNASLSPADNYIMKISGSSDSILLPLQRESDGRYISSEFIPLGDTGSTRYLHGIRVIHVPGNACHLAVERVVKL